MPYIKQEDRENYNNLICMIAERINRMNDIEKFPGQLNYIITTLIKQTYLAKEVDTGKTMGYSEYNSIIGMLDCCKMEYYRRSVVEYEDKKIIENGDV